MISLHYRSAFAAARPANLEQVGKFATSSVIGKLCDEFPIKTNEIEDVESGKYGGTQSSLKFLALRTHFCESSQKFSEKSSNKTAPMAEGGVPLPNHSLEVEIDENNNENVFPVPNPPQMDDVEVESEEEESENEDDILLELDTDDDAGEYDHLVNLDIANRTQDPNDFLLAFENWSRKKMAEEAREHAAQARAQVNARGGGRGGHNLDEDDGGHYSGGLGHGGHNLGGASGGHYSGLVQGGHYLGGAIGGHYSGGLGQGGHNLGGDDGGHYSGGLGHGGVDGDDDKVSDDGEGDMDLGSGWSSHKHQVFSKQLNEQQFLIVTFRVNFSLVGETAGTVKEENYYNVKNIFTVNSQWFL